MRTRSLKDMHLFPFAGIAGEARPVLRTPIEEY
jgi:hypothetical protein